MFLEVLVESSLSDALLKTATGASRGVGSSFIEYLLIARYIKRNEHFIDSVCFKNRNTFIFS